MNVARQARMHRRLLHTAAQLYCTIDGLAIGARGFLAIGVVQNFSTSSSEPHEVELRVTPRAPTPKFVEQVTVGINTRALYIYQKSPIDRVS